MRNLILLIILLTTSVNIIAQSLIDPYEARTTSPTFSSITNSYNGEFMIHHSRTINGFAISYSFEVVSFPFMPAGFRDGGDANSSTITRNLILPDESTLGPIICGEAASGYGWETCLYQKTNNIRFLSQSVLLSGASQDITLASNSFMSGASYTCEPIGAMYLPHTILRININYHLGTSIEDPIILSTPYYVDNTRGRMRDYPFRPTNTAASDLSAYDLLFIPSIEHDPNNNHLYSTTSNSSWSPTGGTINYFPPFNLSSVDNSNSLSQFIYPLNSDLNSPYSYYDIINYGIYNYPAPYCLPSFRWLSANGMSYVGFENDGTINPGITHTYIIDKSMDLKVINPIEKIIYNPSETNINIQNGNHTLVFPTGYTFKTINGLFPSVAMVNNTDPGNLYRDRRKVNVSNSGFSNSVNQHTSVYHVKSGSVLIIEPCVSIIDATIKVEQGGIVKYDASRVYLNNNCSIVQSDPNNPGTITANYNYNNQVYPDCKQECYNISNYNLYQTQYNSDIQITSNTTWNTSNIANDFNISSNVVKVPGTITVKQGYTLTIESGLSFQFSEVGKIIVEKGAKLVVNGTYGNEVEFTSACNNMWEGIEVWGDETITQYANPHSATQQGYLELNYANVSNALTGVLAGQRDNLSTITDKSKAGGLVKAVNSTFENNGTSVEFLPFQYFINNIKLPNYSLFENCSFKTTALLNDQELFSEQAGTQIKLNQLHFYANNIKNCVFYTDKSKFDPAKRGVAIKGHKSSLRLFYSDPSSFEGFTEAILIENSNDGEKVYIDNCTFDDNIHSIVMDAVSYARIYRNDIDVPNSENFDYSNSFVDQHGYNNPVGIYMRYCQINDLQENTIIGNNPSSGLPYSYGIITNSTTGFANTSQYKSLLQQQKSAQTDNGFGRMYNNSISGLSYAVQGELNNGANMRGGLTVPTPNENNYNISSFLPQKGVGEQFKCNNLTSNLNSDVNLIGLYDGNVLPNPVTYYGEFRDQGICSGANGPAGNSFNSPSAGFNLERSITNAVDYYYNYHNNFSSPSNNFDQSVNTYINKCTTITSNSNTCPDLLSIPCQDLQCLKDLSQQKADVVATISATLALTIDGGNTNDLLNIIETETDQYIYDELINNSPYLSDEVLLALINKEPIIDESFLVDIIIANCGLSDTIIIALVEYDLSTAAREIINASINNYSERSQIYAEQNNALFELNIARMDVINYGLDNVTETNNSEILIELQQDNSLSGKYRQLDWLMQCGYESDAENLLANIATIEGDNNSHCYKIAQINLELMGENSLTYNQNTTLQEIINTMPYSSIPAQSLLKYYARKKYERAPFISTGSDARKGRPMTEQKNKEHYFRIYPNPTERDITISFNEISDGIIQIRSISGSLIKSYNVFSRKEIKLNVSSIVNGLYIVVYLPDDLSETKFSKLIIQR